MYTFSFKVTHGVLYLDSMYKELLNHAMKESPWYDNNPKTRNLVGIFKQATHELTRMEDSAAKLYI